MSEKQVLLPTFEFQGSAGIVQKPYLPEALPIMTFTDTLTLYEGSEIIEMVHYKYAHSDGDIVVHFNNADIFQTGDIFVTYGLPYIDEAAGGDLYYMIEALNKLLLHSNENTKFIPGHGPVCSIRELKEYRDLLSTILNNVETLTRENRKLEEILIDTKSKIPFETKDADKFIEQTYRSVKRHLSNQKG
jgi:glyoxylase-like metal-dependent hydrolase (beta-lactamase superfamily II)